MVGRTVWVGLGVGRTVWVGEGMGEIVGVGAVPPPDETGSAGIA